jgi:uncharacterized protein (TIGR04255 family)
MSSSRVTPLKHAPIKEALIDLRVQLPSNFSLDSLRPAIDAAKTEYPIERPMQTFGVIFDTQEHKAMPVTDQQVGVALWSADGSKVLQFRFDGFSHNRLRPYSSWEEFFEEAMKWWDVYVEAVNPPLVVRLGLKYTNRLLLPDFNLEKYFYYLPVDPRGIEGEVPYFMQQIRFHKPEHDIDVLITEMMEENLEDNKLPIILDIDTYKNVSLLPHDESIHGIFKLFHTIKNDVFFENLTDEAIALCK